MYNNSQKCGVIINRQKERIIVKEWGHSCRPAIIRAEHFIHWTSTDLIQHRQQTPICFDEFRPTRKQIYFLMWRGCYNTRRETFKDEMRETYTLWTGFLLLRPAYMTVTLTEASGESVFLRYMYKNSAFILRINCKSRSVKLKYAIKNPTCYKWEHSPVSCG